MKTNKHKHTDILTGYYIGESGKSNNEMTPTLRATRPLTRRYPSSGLSSPSAQLSSRSSCHQPRSSGARNRASDKMIQLKSDNMIAHGDHHHLWCGENNLSNCTRLHHYCLKNIHPHSSFFFRTRIFVSSFKGSQQKHTLQSTQKEEYSDYTRLISTHFQSVFTSWCQVRL